MRCCANCFKDTEIKGIISGSKIIGDCDFCGSKNAYVYNIGTDSILRDLFDELLDLYTPSCDLPATFPHEHTDLIKNTLYYNWNVFNLKPDSIYRLLKTICEERYANQPELFDSPVGILQIIDKDYLNKNSILKNYKWSDFVKGIKEDNRFHSNYINKEVFSVFLSRIVKTYKSGEILWRGRICPSEKGFAKKEMGAPPVFKAKGGRVNPPGISLLYLSDSKDTTLYEIRAGVYDYVTVGKFRLKKDIKIIDLTNIDGFSPFTGIDKGFDYTQYALNVEHLKMIAEEIAKPLRNDNEFDYLPTQYISDFIKSLGYDGIEYKSTMRSSGRNLAVFDPSSFKCMNVEVYDIKSINHSYEKVNSR